MNVILNLIQENGIYITTIFAIISFIRYWIYIPISDQRRKINAIKNNTNNADMIRNQNTRGANDAASSPTVPLITASEYSEAGIQKQKLNGPIILMSFSILGIVMLLGFDLVVDKWFVFSMSASVVFFIVGLIRYKEIKFANMLVEIPEQLGKDIKELFGTDEDTTK